MDDRQQKESADEAVAEAQRLAEQLRRIIHRLVLVRPDITDLRAAADGASAFADRLEALPTREGAAQVSEAGLLPGRFLGHSPLSGSCNALAPPVRLWSVNGPDDARTIHGDVTFGPAYEGPPGHVHGGYVAAMFDELLGRAQGAPGFTGTLTVIYRRPSPLGRLFDLHAWVDRIEGRKRYIRGTCHADGVLICEAEGIFVAPRGGDPLTALRAAQVALARSSRDRESDDV